MGFKPPYPASIDPMLGQCWASVIDGGPELTRHWINVCWADVLCGLLVLKMNLSTYRPLGYERVYLPLHKVADAPFHIQDDVI